MTGEVKTFIRNQRDYLKKNQSALTIDADTHLTDIRSLPKELSQRFEENSDYYHGRPVDTEIVLKQMGLAAVDMALSWQNPAATAYSDDASFNYDSLLAANEYVVSSARRNPQRIIPAAWTDPKALGLAKARQLAEHCVNSLGVGIVKINPAQNQFPINSPDVMELVEAIIASGAIVAFHYGSDTPYTPAAGLEEVASRFADVPFLAVHMGGGGASFEEAEDMYMESRKLGLRRPNLYFVLSAKRDTHMESDFVTYQLAGAPYNEHLLCASDSPYGNPVFQFAGFRAMLEGFLSASDHPDQRVRDNPGLFDRSAIQNYLGGNMARLMVRVYDRLLDKQGKA
ncbi:MAG: amidohydrolase family protein [Spirochaetaceae bacterium]|nr:MAG: amidohydrolase family protein [Spirochaetaceae bacterium]